MNGLIAIILNIEPIIKIKILIPKSLAILENLKSFFNKEKSKQNAKNMPTVPWYEKIPSVNNKIAFTMYLSLPFISTFADSK